MHSFYDSFSASCKHLQTDCKEIVVNKSMEIGVALVELHWLSFIFMQNDLLLVTKSRLFHSDTGFFHRYNEIVHRKS